MKANFFIKTVGIFCLYSVFATIILLFSSQVAYAGSAALVRNGTIIAHETFLKSATNLSIKMSKDNATVMIGDTCSLNAKVTGSSQIVTWSSSNVSIASVDKYGTVRGKKAGRAIITASIGTIRATCAITVVSVSIPEEIVMKKGTKKALTVKSSYRQSYMWESRKASVAVVTNGIVSAKAIGVGIIALNTNDSRVTCKVTVIDYDLSPKSATIKAGGTKQLSMWVKGTSYPVHWESSDKSIATVDENGKVKGISAGKLQ